MTSCVPGRDSTALLIDSRPFYVNGQIVEKVSPVLKQALEDAALSTDTSPFPLPLSNGIPPDRHYALFALAVERAYTNDVSRLPNADLPPLWSLVDFLQMDALRAFVLDRLVLRMRDDCELAERSWEAAASFPCEGLRRAAAGAVLRHAGRGSTSAQKLKRMLCRMHAAAARPHELGPYLAGVMRAQLVT